MLSKVQVARSHQPWSSIPPWTEHPSLPCTQGGGQQPGFKHELCSFCICPTYKNTFIAGKMEGVGFTKGEWSRQQ